MKRLLFAFVALIVAALALAGLFQPQIAAPAETAVWAVQPGTTLYYLNNALQGGAGTQILTNGSSFFVTWQMHEGVGFTLINSSGEVTADLANWWNATKGNGNQALAPSVREVTRYLEGQGWAKVSWKDVPESLRGMVASAYATYKNLGPAGANAMLTAGNILISIVVLPVAVVPDCPPSLPITLCDGYTQYE